MPQVEVNNALGHSGGKCQQLWRRGVTCPNPAAFLIVNTTNNGFAVMCLPHKESFVENYQGDFTVEPWTAAREMELQLILAACGPGAG